MNEFEFGEVKQMSYGRKLAMLSGVEKKAAEIRNQIETIQENFLGDLTPR